MRILILGGDGYLGWPEKAPFDGIVVGAGAPKVPQPLVEQLAVGARLVIPVDGPDGTHVLVVRKEAGGKTTVKKTLPVKFVPLTGEHADRDRKSK